MGEDIPGAEPTRVRHDILRVDEICDDFETAWQSDARPRIEDFLDRIGEPDRDRLFRELLCLELDYRDDRDEIPDRAEYFARFPGYVNTINDVFDSIITRDWAQSDTNAESDTQKQADEDVDKRSSMALKQKRRGGASPAGETDANRRFGNYELLEEIARGGMGIVYRARQSKPSRIVAIKTILAGHLATREHVERFLAEAEAAAQLQHPGIVAIHEVGQSEGQHFFSMDLVEGTSLAALIREKPIASRQAAQYVKLIAEAIHFAHQRGVLHRDLKPSNVLVDATDQPRVTDFGLAKQIESDSDLTVSGQVLGTPSYMPPEQASGQISRIDARSDVYALGATLYALLTGRPPFQAENAAATLRQVLENDPVTPGQLNPEIDRDLETICLKCLEKDAAKRYGSAEELTRELARFLAGKPIQARPISRTAKMLRWCKRNPALASACGLAMILLVAVAGVSMALAVQQSQSAERARQEKEEIQKLLKEKEELVDSLARAKKQTEKAMIEAKRLAATALMDLGLNRCEQGELRVGVSWLVRALEQAPAEAKDLDRAIRTNLAGWSQLLTTREASLNHGPTIYAIACGPDGKVFATGAGKEAARGAGKTIPGEGSVQLWNAQTLQLIGQPLKHELPVHRIAFSADGKRIATGCYDGTVRVWDVSEGRPLTDPLPHDGKPLAIGFAGDGVTVFSADSRRIHRWDATKGQSIGEPLTLDSEVRRLVFSPDGKTAATASGSSKDHKVRLWDLSTGKQVGEPLTHPGIRGSEGQVAGLAFSGDGKLLATVGKDVTRFWNLATRQPTGQPLAHGKVGPGVLALSYDGSIAISAHWDSFVRLWDVSTGRLIGEPLDHRRVPRAVALGHDGRMILTGEWDSWAKTSRLHVWRTQRPRPYQALLHLPENRLRRMANGSDGRVMLLEDKRDGIRLWDTVSDKLVDTAEANKRVEQIYGWSFAPDGDPLILAETGIVDVSTGKPRGQPVTDGKAVALGPDGETVLVAKSAVVDGRRRRVLQLWDTSAGTFVGEAIACTTYQKAAISADNRTTLVGGELRSSDSKFGHKAGVARLFDTTTGEQIGPLLRHRYAVLSVALSPDGKLALTGSGYDHFKGPGEARLWDARTGKPLGPPMPHEGPVKSVAFSPDGLMAVTGSEEKHARLWDVATGRRIGPPLRNQDIVLSAAFDSEGDGLVTISPVEARVWSRPRPLAGRVEQIVLWAQSLAGMEVDTAGIVRELDEETCAERRKQLEAMGGPPVLHTPL